MHSAYLAIRPRLLTQLALNRLYEKAVSLRPAPLAQMRFNGKHLGRMDAFAIFPAIRSAVMARHQHSTTAKITLELMPMNASTFSVWRKLFGGIWSRTMTNRYGII